MNTIVETEYRINCNGECYICHALYYNINQQPVCVAFHKNLESDKFIKQCQACKDYLDFESKKVYCNDCEFYIHSFGEDFCTKDNINDNGYCINCKLKRVK